MTTFTLTPHGQKHETRIRRTGSSSGVSLLLVALLVAVLPGGHVAALEAAGGFKSGSEIEGAEHFIKGIQGSVVWLGVTALGLAVAVIAILFMAGHSRAHDLALKTAIGAFILASISGIVA
jgi:hypothetical protein